MANPTGKGGWQKGVSGNPKGRAPKGRALTDMLLAELAHTHDVDGKSVSGKRILSRVIAGALTTGKLQFPGDDKATKLNAYQYLELAKWWYGHLDGPARQELDVSSDNVFRIVVEYEDEDASDGGDAETGAAAPGAEAGDA